MAPRTVIVTSGPPRHKIPDCVPVWVHNFSKYDAFLLLPGLGEYMKERKREKTTRLNFLSNGGTGLLQIRVGNLFLGDSMSFMSGSLANLAKTLVSNDDLVNSTNHTPDFADGTLSC